MEETDRTQISVGLTRKQLDQLDKCLNEVRPVKCELDDPFEWTMPYEIVVGCRDEVWIVGARIDGMFVLLGELAADVANYAVTFATVPTEWLPVPRPGNRLGSYLLLERYSFGNLAVAGTICPSGRVQRLERGKCYLIAAL